MTETLRPENAGQLRDALRWAAAEHTVRSFMISILLVRTALASGGYQANFGGVAQEPLSCPDRIARL